MVQACGGNLLEPYEIPFDKPNLRRWRCGDGDQPNRPHDPSRQLKQPTGNGRGADQRRGRETPIGWLTGSDTRPCHAKILTIVADDIVDEVSLPLPSAAPAEMSPSGTMRAAPSMHMQLDSAVHTPEHLAPQDN